MLNQICEIEQNLIRKLDKEKAYFISSQNQQSLYIISSTMYKRGYKIVLLPNGFENLKIDTLKEYDIMDVKIKEVDIAGDWATGMFTSGSTASPKLVIHTKSQVEYTLQLYKKIYKLTKDSVILSSMPVAYNFTFIAGVLNSCNIGCKFYYKKPDELLSFIVNNSSRYDKVVILANPVILDCFSEYCIDSTLTFSNIMIDSGGAPLSVSAMKWFRKRGFDIHEGYGLTETCSLTHFDTESSNVSLGSVGAPLEEITISLENKESRPLVKIFSPNAGKQIDLNGNIIQDFSKGLETTDIAKLEGDKLVLLGRYPDVAINGYWPKDTLNLIGEVIGPKCALVQHLDNENIKILLWSNLSMQKQMEIKEMISNKLQICTDRVDVVINSNSLLHSMKLKRFNNDKIYQDKVYHGKVILITGVTSGIGLHLLKRFVEKSAIVIGLYNNNDEMAESLRKNYKDFNCHIFKCDVTNEIKVQEIINIINKMFGKIDILINNAGVSLDGTLENYDLNLYDKVYKINLFGKVNCIQKCIPLLKKAKYPKVINIASRLATKPMEDSVAYCSMASAIVMMTKVAALELMKYNISVNAISPSLVKTPLSLGFYTKEQIKNTEKKAIYSRLCKEEDVFDAIDYICKNNDVFMTGENINISGGILLK